MFHRAVYGFLEPSNLGPTQVDVAFERGIGMSKLCLSSISVCSAKRSYHCNHLRALNPCYTFNG